LGQRDAKAELDSLYALLEQPWMTSNESGSDATKTEKKFVTFEGIGPTDEQTGVPLATRIVSTQHTAVDALSHCIKSGIAKRTSKLWCSNEVDCTILHLNVLSDLRSGCNGVPSSRIP